MSAKEPYDYLSTAIPNYADNTLNSGSYVLKAQQKIIERGMFNQKIHLGYDGSEQRITLGSSPVFYVVLNFSVKSPSDIGKLMEFYFESGMGYGIGRTFKWYSDADGHTYVVRFTEQLQRTLSTSNLYGVSSVTLKLVGKI